MGTTTFESVKAYAKRHDIIVEKRGGRTYEAYKKDDHGTTAVAFSLSELLDEVNSFIESRVPGVYSRRVYWFKAPGFRGETATCLIIGDGYERKLSTYKKLIEIARRSFPDLKDEQVDISQVLTSDTIKGYPVIVFPISEPKSYLPGYRGFDIDEPVEFGY